MSTPIQPVPDLVLASEFPSLADRPAGTYNAKAKAFADSANPMSVRNREIALTAHNNAVAATEQAGIATQAAQDATTNGANQVALATVQADRAEAAKLAAESAANFKGSWSSLTGPLTIPASTFHAGRFWVLLSDVADVAANEPGVGASWESISGGSIAIDGPLTLYTNGTAQYTITNYSAFSTYSVSVSAGTASIAGDTITLISPSTPQTIALTVTMDWTSENFSITVNESPYIATPAATPSNFGDPFEGGFYAGMYWDEIIKSDTSTTIGTGSKTFTCPTLTSAVTYIGHQIEIRSRANPANKMVATVTSSSLSAKTITVNVTSVGGSGTFSDWSIMSRFRNIVAPKASGENAGIALNNSNAAFPAGCQSLVNGWAATEAMRLAGTSTEYPAAHWARSQVIGGFNDWHIPARDVLELSWRTLKPTTTANYTTADRGTTQTFDYKRDGAYGDTANTHGTNNNSAPTGAAYTSSVPGQTAASAFKTGGAEAYEFGSAYYWSSTEYSTSSAWRQAWFSSAPGYQDNSGKATADRVRLVRRSII